jgi:predicted thioesterase
MPSEPLGPSVGARAEIVATVETGDTAVEIGSGDVEVLATPRLLALCEEATVAAVADRIPGTVTTVGVEVHLEHLVASSIGAEVRAVAILEEVAGRRLRFTVEAFEGDRLIGRGSVVRVAVPRDRFP